MSDGAAAARVGARFDHVLVDEYQDTNALQSSVLFFSSRRRHTIFDCDWSSDVCSSDLVGLLGAAIVVQRLLAQDPGKVMRLIGFVARSEERRVGKECRSRWWSDHLLKEPDVRRRGGRARRRPLRSRPGRRVPGHQRPPVVGAFFFKQKTAYDI